MVCQAYSCGPAYAGVALGTVSLYSVFTLGVTQWRTQFRVNMNKVTLVMQSHGIVDKVGVTLYVTFHHGRDQKVRRVCPVHWRLVAGCRCGGCQSGNTSAADFKWVHTPSVI